MEEEVMGVTKERQMNVALKWSATVHKKARSQAILHGLRLNDFIEKAVMDYVDRIESEKRYRDRGN